MAYFSRFISRYRFSNRAFAEANAPTRNKISNYVTNFITRSARTRGEFEKLKRKRLILVPKRRSPSAPSPLLSFSSCLKASSFAQDIHLTISIWPKNYKK